MGRVRNRLLGCRNDLTYIMEKDGFLSKLLLFCCKQPLGSWATLKTLLSTIALRMGFLFPQCSRLDHERDTANSNPLSGFWPWWVELTDALIASHGGEERKGIRKGCLRGQRDIIVVSISSLSHHYPRSRAPGPINISTPSTLIPNASPPGPTKPIPQTCCKCIGALPPL